VLALRGNVVAQLAAAIQAHLRTIMFACSGLFRAELVEIGRSAARVFAAARCGDDDATDAWFRSGASEREESEDTTGESRPNFPKSGSACMF
jgi:hypothetical protein